MANVVITPIRDRYLRQTNQEQQQLYDHLLDCVRRESPEQLIDNFHYLFIKGTGYKDNQVRSALQKIINSKEAKQEFKLILNRCCHIIINHWQLHPQLQPAIPELVALFENLPPPSSVSYSATNRLRQLVRDFTDTDQYLKLQRIARVISQSKEAKSSIGNLINRYPYLYEHCLLSEDSSYEHQQTVRKIQAQIERCFEVSLSQYVTYKVRQAQIARNPSPSTEVRRMIRPVKNPTLLSDRELGKAIKQFAGKVQGGYTYRDLSQNFLTHSIQIPTYKAFKDDLYEYLVSSIDPKYGKHKFNDKLYKKLQSTLPNSNSQKPSEFLMLRTSSQLLNFLVVENPQNPNHYVFMDLITNVGAASTIGLLLKLVLFCRKVKPYLEKRFSILFNHYESFTKKQVPWLVRALENLHIAFSINFGRVDLSYLNL
ncbi:MAG: hypothetical protein AB4426_35275 [Xenococcaceae cyanobacterium]